MSIPTCITQLDEALGDGLPDTGLVLLGALVGSGQQELATHLALTLARESGRNLRHWLWRRGGWDDGTLEGEARARMIAAHTGLPFHEVHNYQLDADQLDVLKAAVLELQALPLELRTDVWAWGRLERRHFEDAIEPGSIHVIERIDDLISEPTAEERQVVAESLAKVAHSKAALIIAVANCVWPEGDDYSLEQAPVAAWSELSDTADLALLAGPIDPVGRAGLWMQVVRGDGETRVWFPVDPRSGRVGGVLRA